MTGGLTGGEEEGKERTGGGGIVMANGEGKGEVEHGEQPGRKGGMSRTAVDGIFPPFRFIALL